MISIDIKLDNLEVFPTVYDGCCDVKSMLIEDLIVQVIGKLLFFCNFVRIETIV